MKLKYLLIKFFIYLSAILTVGVLIWILAYILYHGIQSINFKFLTSTKNSEGGIFPMIITTIYMIVLSLIISIPIGIFSAIYLNEYTKSNKLVKIIRFGIDSLSGIPSIIFGLFGMILFVNILKFKFSVLSGSLTLSIMILPLIIKTTEEALKTVKNSLREGSLALGSSKIKTIFKIVLPSAVPGILTGIILSIGRIVGESAAVYFTAGMVPKIPSTIMSSARTLSVHMFVLVNEGISFNQAYATASVLIIIVAFTNLSANKFASVLKRN